MYKFKIHTINHRQFQGVIKLHLVSLFSIQTLSFTETLEETIESGPLCTTDLRLAYKKRLKNKIKKFPKKQIFFFYLFSMQLFSADATMLSIFVFCFFAHKKLKKSPQKVAYLVHLGVFKSLQP